MSTETSERALSLELGGQWGGKGECVDSSHLPTNGEIRQYFNSGI